MVVLPRHVCAPTGSTYRLQRRLAHRVCDGQPGRDVDGDDAAGGWHSHSRWHLRPRGDAGHRPRRGGGQRLRRAAHRPGRLLHLRPNRGGGPGSRERRDLHNRRSASRSEQGARSHSGTTDSSETDSDEVTAGAVGTWCFRAEYDSEHRPRVHGLARRPHLGVLQRDRFNDDDLGSDVAPERLGHHHVCRRHRAERQPVLHAARRRRLHRGRSCGAAETFTPHERNLAGDRGPRRTAPTRWTACRSRPPAPSPGRFSLRRAPAPLVGRQHALREAPRWSSPTDRSWCSGRRGPGQQSPSGPDG